MTLRFSSLGSGSEGNALVVQVGDSVLMMDCGFGLAETEYASHARPLPQRTWMRL